MDDLPRFPAQGVCAQPPGSILHKPPQDRGGVNPCPEKSLLMPTHPPYPYPQHPPQPCIDEETLPTAEDLDKVAEEQQAAEETRRDRKSTRLNSSHANI